MAPIEENVNMLKTLQSKYPNKIKIMSSEDEIELLDMDNVMKGGNNVFDNKDPSWIEFIAQQIATGKEVAIVPAGKYKLLIISAFKLFKDK